MSNKTLVVNVKKTKLVRKVRFVVVGFLFVALAGITLFFVLKQDSVKSPVSVEPACTKMGSGCFELERLDRNEERTRGLSDRPDLGANKGLLFVFDGVREQCMWMKDMKFSIDMIWLDRQKKILKIEENVLPDTYPKTFCADNTKYVIELNAGVAQRAGLKIGDRLQL